MNNRVLDAIKLAVVAHDGQVDKGGKPYILHPLTVAEFVDNDDLRILAVLHDTVEDTDVTNDDIRSQFGDRIADALDHLTHRQGESYDEYIDRVSEDPMAIKVKLADLKNNMDLSRIQDPKPEDYRRIDKYARAASKLLSISERAAS